MAYRRKTSTTRRAPARKSSRRNTAVRRTGTGRRRAAVSRKRGGTRSATPRTIRIVIEQPTAQAVPGQVEQQMVAPRKAMF